MNMRKREYWQMITMAAIMSGRAHVGQATAMADELVKAYEAREKQWDAEERLADEQRRPLD